MKRVLPLDKMSVADKLAAMEQLREDLSRDPEAVPSPPWHETVLEERRKKVKRGKSRFSGLEAVKGKVRNAHK
jgi:hypothetical protein